MEPLICFPNPLPQLLSTGLEDSRYKFQAINTIEEIESLAPSDGWSGAVISCTESFSQALTICEFLRHRDLPLRPLLLVVSMEHLHKVDPRSDLYDDFVIDPYEQIELTSRLAQLFWRVGSGSRPELIEHGPLSLNLETYQATINGRHLDLTFMEYELLRFLAAEPGRVFSREILLSRVWGYEYYGGARTVDVHVRRLRAKIGEEHASLIQTVRSVGYKFGESRWS